MGLSSKHFSEKEVSCRHCGENRITRKLLDKLERLRELAGKPVIINSAYRCKVHNAAVGGVKNSFHTQGVAADVRISGMTPIEVAELAEMAGFDGIGLYDTFTHVDVRGYRARWDYRTRK